MQILHCGFRPAQIRRLRCCVLRSLVYCLLIAGSCFAQTENFHSCTFNAGGGPSFDIGSDKNSFDSGWNFQAGGGFSVTGRPDRHRQWSVFLDVNFMYSQLGITQNALDQAIAQNPLNIGIQQATTDSHAKYYSTTLDPTLRLPGKHIKPYFFGGFGWFRRSLQFRGSSVQGSLLQPNSPVVFGEGGNSGAWDAGAGLNFKLPAHGMMLYAETRFIRGLGINSATTLFPFSMGFRW